MVHVLSVTSGLDLLQKKSKAKFANLALFANLGAIWEGPKVRSRRMRRTEASKWAVLAVCLLQQTKQFGCHSESAPLPVPLATPVPLVGLGLGENFRTKASPVTLGVNVGEEVYTIQEAPYMISIHAALYVYTTHNVISWVKLLLDA